MEIKLRNLLEQVRQGDESAFARLLEDYESLTAGAVRRFEESFRTEGMDAQLYGPEDLKQIVSVALYKAAVSYHADEEGENVSFGLYAKICINNALISALRKCRTQRKCREAEAYSEKQRRESRVQHDPLQELISTEGAKSAVRLFRGELSEYETVVFDLTIAGKSIAEIAEQLGKSRKSVSNALYRMKVKIRGLQKA